MREGEEEVEGDDDEGQGEGDGEGRREANKILDHLELHNYDDVEKRLDEPEMTATLKRNYLQKSLKTLIGEEDK